MNANIIKLILVINCVAFLSCDFSNSSDGDVIVCTEEFVPAIRVDVFDKETGSANACGARVIFEDGNFFEEIKLEDNDNCDNTFTFSGAGEREGTYDITVSKEGYVDWHQYDVAVSSNLCHVNTVSLQAYLEK